MERKIGRSSFFASASDVSSHGCQSTGLRACCRRYGLVSPARRLDGGSVVMASRGLWAIRVPCNQPLATHRNCILLIRGNPLMSDVVIKVREHGPILVSGPI